MKIAITGAGGLVGRRLTRSLLADNHEVRALNRQAGPPEALAGADAVVHLAGEPVAQRWTAESKARIRESRVPGTRRLVEALGGVPTLVSASAIGIYGSRGDEALTESSPPGEGFLAEVSRAWEQEADRAVSSGVRVVKVRIGVVLAADGGALAKMLPPFRMGAGGRLGSGAQWMSWIHLDDLVSLIRFAIENPRVSGALNGTAPQPVTNAEFTKELAAVLRRPAIFPVPAFALRLMFGEMSSVLLASQRVLPRAASDAGFVFRYPELGAALRDLLG